MFEKVHLHTRVEDDGNLRISLPSGLPPDSEVDVTVSVRRRKSFASREEWETHVRNVVGSIPDLERPEDFHPSDVEPL